MKNPENPFSIEKTDDYTVLFVNSEEPPTSTIPQNSFSYSETGSGKLRFFQLYKVIYTQERDGVGVNHCFYDWYEIKIKPHCEKALKSMIDNFDAVSEFKA